MTEEDSFLEEVKELEFKLSSPIKIHKGGKLVEADMLVLKAPSFENVNEASAIQALYVRLADNIPSDKIEKAKEENTELKEKTEKTSLEKAQEKENIDRTIYTTLVTYGGKEPEYITNRLKILFRSGVITIEGEALTNHYLNQITLKDYRYLAGKYINTFLHPSLD